MSETQILPNNLHEEECTEVTSPEIVGFIKESNNFHKIKKGCNKVGRDINLCSIVLEDNTVSKIHAVIESEGIHDTFIYDVGSTNHTKLGKVLLKPHIRYKLEHENLITLGNTTIKFILNTDTIENKNYFPLISSKCFKSDDDIKNLDELFDLETQIESHHAVAPVLSNTSSTTQKNNMFSKPNSKEINDFLILSNQSNTFNQQIFKPGHGVLLLNNNTFNNLQPNLLSKQSEGTDSFKIFNLETQCSPELALEKSDQRTVRKTEEDSEMEKCNNIVDDNQNDALKASKFLDVESNAIPMPIIEEEEIKKMKFKEKLHQSLIDNYINQNIKEEYKKPEKECEKKIKIEKSTNKKYVTGEINNFENLEKKLSYTQELQNTDEVTSALNSNISDSFKNFMNRENTQVVVDIINKNVCNQPSSVETPKTNIESEIILSTSDKKSFNIRNENNVSHLSTENCFLPLVEVNSDKETSSYLQITVDNFTLEKNTYKNCSDFLHLQKQNLEIKNLTISDNCENEIGINSLMPNEKKVGVHGKINSHCNIIVSSPSHRSDEAKHLVGVSKQLLNSNPHLSSHLQILKMTNLDSSPDYIDTGLTVKSLNQNLKIQYENSFEILKTSTQNNKENKISNDSAKDLSSYVPESSEDDNTISDLEVIEDSPNVKRISSFLKDDGNLYKPIYSSKLNFVEDIKLARNSYSDSSNSSYNFDMKNEMENENDCNKENTITLKNSLEASSLKLLDDYSLDVHNPNFVSISSQNSPNFDCESNESNDSKNLNNVPIFRELEKTLTKFIEKKYSSNLSTSEPLMKITEKKKISDALKEINIIAQNQAPEKTPPSVQNLEAEMPIRFDALEKKNEKSFSKVITNTQLMQNKKTVNSRIMPLAGSLEGNLSTKNSPKVPLKRRINNSIGKNFKKRKSNLTSNSKKRTYIEEEVESINEMKIRKKEETSGPFNNTEIPPLFACTEKLSLRNTLAINSSSDKCKNDEFFIENSSIKIVFTGLDKHSLDDIIYKLGGKKTNDIVSGHVLVTDRVRRTVKFLCAVGLSIPITSPEWLLECKKLNRFISPWNYILKCEESEKKWNFNLKKSLEKSKKKKLLEGFSVFATKNVKPPVKDILAIAKCCGAITLSDVPEEWNKCTIVISCLEDEELWPPPKLRSLKIVHAEFILSGVLRQTLDFTTYKLR